MTYSQEDVEQGSLSRRATVNAYNIVVLAFLCTGSIAFGYSNSVITSTLGQPEFIKYFDLDTRSNGENLIATMNGLFQTGGLLGTFLFPWIADSYGRRVAIGVSAVVMIISNAIMAGAQDVGTFIAFRFVAGASGNGMLAAIPLLMNEIVPSQIRGTLLDLHGVFLVFGYVIQGWAGLGFYFWNGGPNTWRPTIALACLWPLLLLFGLPFVPESPRWSCMQGRLEEAEAVLLRLHSNKSDPEHQAARAEFYQICKQIAIDKTLSSSWLDIMRKPSYRKRALFAMGATVLGQSTGVLVINNYGPSLYANLNFSETKQLTFSAAWMTFGFGMNIAGMFFIDRFPRPKYMAVGAFGTAATLIIEAALVANFVPSDNEAALQAAVAVLFMFQIFYGGILDGTQFSYVGELFPTHLQAKGFYLGVGAISLVDIIFLQSAPTAFANIGWKFYLVFIILGGVGGTVVWFYFPDTAHKPLEEIAAMFGDADELAITSDVIFDETTNELRQNTKGKQVKEEVENSL